MHPYPHRYAVRAEGTDAGRVTLHHAGLEPLASSPPVEFDGPGDAWSPETLLVAALADCFLLTFRAVARARSLPWVALDVDVEGTLDRVDGVASFTAFRIRARLALGAGGDEATALAALVRAKKGCLISNSLKGEMTLESEVTGG